MLPPGEDAGQELGGRGRVGTAWPRWPWSAAAPTEHQSHTHTSASSPQPREKPRPERRRRKSARGLSRMPGSALCALNPCDAAARFPGCRPFGRRAAFLCFQEASPKAVRGARPVDPILQTRRLKSLGSWTRPPVSHLSLSSLIPTASLQFPHHILK